MKTYKSLIEILQEKGVIEEGKTTIPTKNHDAAWKAFFEYFDENGGYINKKLTQGYKFVRSDKFLDKVKSKELQKTLDLFLQVYIGGTMTRTDQEAFAIIAKKNPHKLTIMNRVMGVAFAYQYYLMAKGSGYLGEIFFSDLNQDKTHEIGLWLVASTITVNVAQAAWSAYTKKACAAISIESGLVNSTSYIRKAYKEKPSDI